MGPSFGTCPSEANGFVSSGGFGAGAGGSIGFGLGVMNGSGAGVD